MSQKNKLPNNFILELFKAAFKDSVIFEILVKYLKYSFLTYDYEKEFWKKSQQLFYLKNRPPSLGIVQAELRKRENVKDFICDIRKSDDVNKKDLIIYFEKYIKESKYVEIFENSAQLYNRGEEDKAIKEFQKGSEEIQNFSLQDKIYDKLFDGFEIRMLDRKNPEKHNDKVPLFIDKLDELSYGGPERGDIVLGLGESGTGKSQFLIHYAVRTAVSGGNTLFVQIEGTRKQVLNRMDAAWSGMLYNDVKFGNFKGDERKQIKKLKIALSKMKGEIYIEAAEKFGSYTISDLRNSIREAKKIYGDIKLCCVDYFELLELNDGITYSPSMERHRQQKLGQQLKQIAMEENLVLATVTQASNLPYELKNDPSFVMTREYLSEDKGKIRPFDFHYTFNQTFDEKKHKNEKNEYASIIRIHVDKAREYASGQTVPIVTNFSRSRFYDKNRTIDYYIENDEIIDFDE